MATKRNTQPKRPRTKGRPTKFTDARTKRILKELRDGASVEVACKCAGLAEATFYLWTSEARKAREDGTPCKYMDFLENVEKAIAQGEMELARTVKRHSRTNWQAAAWMLERKFPERWGRKFIRVEASGPGGDPIPVNATLGGMIGVTVHGLDEILEEQKTNQEQPAPEQED